MSTCHCFYNEELLTPKRQHYSPIQIVDADNCPYFYKLFILESTRWGITTRYTLMSLKSSSGRYVAVFNGWNTAVGVDMDCKRPTFAANVYIFTILQLTGDINNCAKGNFLQLCLYEKSNMSCRLGLLFWPPGQCVGHVTENYDWWFIILNDT